MLSFPAGRLHAEDVENIRVRVAPNPNLGLFFLSLIVGIPIYVSLVPLQSLEEGYRAPGMVIGLKQQQVKTFDMD